MLISICLYMFNVVCAATGNMQNCHRQLAMQSWHCACMQDVNHLIKKKKKKKKKVPSSIPRLVISVEVTSQC